MKTDKIFESNPDLKEVHMTSDGQSFYKLSDAKNHAKTLENKSVELVVNPSQIDVVADEVDFEEVDNLSQLEIGDGIEQIKAVSDGYENISIAGIQAGKVIISEDLSVQETKDLIKVGGEGIIAQEVETPEVETPEVEIPEIEAPEIEAPEVETPEVETPEIETPEVETPEIETPEVEAPKGKNKSINTKR